MASNKEHIITLRPDSSDRKPLTVTLTLKPPPGGDAIQCLRAVLKGLWRTHRCKAVSVAPAPEAGEAEGAEVEANNNPESSRAGVWPQGCLSPLLRQKWGRTRDDIGTQPDRRDLPAQSCNSEAANAK